MRTKWIFIHGGWGGSWQWSPVRRELKQRGIESYAPDLPGMGSLSGKGINLQNFVNHISEIVKYDEDPVNIAAFSFGGMTATALTDKLRDQIGKLVYIDAFVPEPGQSFSHIAGKKITRQIKAYSHVMGDEEMIPPFFEIDPRYRSHPLNTLFTPVDYIESDLEKLKPIYVECTAKDREWTFTPLLEKMAHSIRRKNWTVYNIESDHMPMFSHTEELLEILL